MKRDNGARIGKERLRQRLARSLEADAKVLDCFAGEGAMYHAVWSRFAGATIDKDRAKALRAAAERPRWSVYAGETVSAIRGGWMRHVPFDLVDVDAYGSPWDVVHAWILSNRERAELTTLVLTDGYTAQASIAPPCKILFREDRKRRNRTPAEVIEVATLRVSAWAETSGLEVRRFDSFKLSRRNRNRQPMWAHVLELAA